MTIDSRFVVVATFVAIVASVTSVTLTIIYLIIAGHEFYRSIVRPVKSSPFPKFVGRARIIDCTSDDVKIMMLDGTTTGVVLSLKHDEVIIPLIVGAEGRVNIRSPADSNFYVAYHLDPQ